MEALTSLVAVDQPRSGRDLACPHATVTAVPARPPILPPPWPQTLAEASSRCPKLPTTFHTNVTIETNVRKNQRAMNNSFDLRSKATKCTKYKE
jgi:hypothetical protein